MAPRYVTAGPFFMEEIMYYLETEEHFDAAHFLKGYAGKCSNLHGHRWRVVAQVQAEALAEDAQQRGMVMDFGDLKEALKTICTQLDHCLICEEGTLLPQTVLALENEGFRLVMLPFRPTAEELARYIYEQLRLDGLPLARVTVYETPTNCAAYEEAER